MLAAASLAAQAPTADSSRDRWKLGPVWRVDAGGQLGLGLGLGVGWSRQERPGPWASPARLALIGRYGINGSRDLSLILAAPGLLADWRIWALLRSERMLRTPYFGPDNQGQVEDSLEQRYGLIYYRYALLRATAHASVQRRLKGPLWLQVGGQLRRYRTAALRQQPTLYRNDIAAAALADTAWSLGSEGRFGLVWDTRDYVGAPQRGALLEVISAFGRLHDLTADHRVHYWRVMLGAREFLTLDDSTRTVLALRQRVSLASDTLPFYLAYEQITSDLPDDGVVGSRLVRLHSGANQLASNQAFVSVDLRHKLLMLRDDPERPIRLWGLLIADAGLLWEPRQAPALRRKAWTLGGGFRVQASKGTLLGLDAGWTDVGGAFTFMTYFSY